MIYLDDIYDQNQGKTWIKCLLDWFFNGLMHIGINMIIIIKFAEFGWINDNHKNSTFVINVFIKAQIIQ